MAKWSMNEENVRVISREKEEDTSPDGFVLRGWANFKARKYVEAEKEFLTAVKYAKAENKYTYMETSTKELLKFYYATKNRAFEAKADKMVWAWYKQYDFKRYLRYKFLGPVVMIGCWLFALLLLFALLYPSMLPIIVGCVVWVYCMVRSFRFMKPKVILREEAKGKDSNVTEMKGVAYYLLYFVYIFLAVAIFS